MSRICNQCGAEMIEDCEIGMRWKIEEIIISKEFRGFFSNKKAKLKAAVCTSCGNVTFYIDEYKEFKDA